MLIGLLAVLAVSTVPMCPPVPGAAAAFERAGTKIVWVGEVHGSNEQPALFGDLVCAASRTARPVVVVLERGQDEQAAWNAFLASDGGAAADTALLRTGQWTDEMQDGRSSQAMLALAERLREYKREGRIREVRMMIPLNEGGERGGYEAAMARSVETALDAAPGALVLAYSGNAHAQKGVQTIHNETYKLAASWLPPAEVVSIDLVGGPGDYWNCQAGTCGAHRARSGATHAREVVFAGAPDGFDATGYTGAPSTASLPAARPATPFTFRTP